MNLKKALALTVLFALGCINLFAQPGTPGDDGGGGENPCADLDAEGCTTPTPIDNWVLLLAIGALVLTAFYLHNKQKKEAVS